MVMVLMWKSDVYILLPHPIPSYHIHFPCKGRRQRSRCGARSGSKYQGGGRWNNSPNYKGTRRRRETNASRNSEWEGAELFYGLAYASFDSRRFNFETTRGIGQTVIIVGLFQFAGCGDGRLVRLHSWLQLVFLFSNVTLLHDLFPSLVMAMYKFSAHRQYRHFVHCRILGTGTT
jgi:hypothetical protein